MNRRCLCRCSTIPNLPNDVPRGSLRRLYDIRVEALPEALMLAVEVAGVVEVVAVMEGDGLAAQRPDVRA